ncbi:MAG: zinc ribbon domain-containing protein [Anaerolineae bacterium]
MPLYEYDCHDCEQPFEKRVSISQADDAIMCPRCGGKRTKRRLSRIAIKGQTTSVSSSAPVPASTSGFS